ncbi:MAG: hypothetical protein GY765_08230 [bacterium]|nr:hypothetical protein [bacterium]
MDKISLSKDRAIAAGQYNKEKEYRLKQMGGEPEKCSFPYSFRESTRMSAEQLTFRLPDSLFSKIIKISKGLDHTIHIILTAGTSHEILEAEPIKPDELENSFGF